MVGKIRDADERQQALDVTRSFIVQAPAGSGKTELLTQRLLTLLAKACDEPEQLIAITFTRKAAAEMRQRLLAALATANSSPAPTAPHALTTWQLAKAVLAVDAQRRWSLLQNPNRLRIQTIDSLCAAIARSAPYLSQFGADPTVLNDPKACYQQAARALMKQLSQPSPWQQALARLLLHLDNDWCTVQQLLTSMLSRRDQWLPHLVEQNDLQEKRKILERGLQNVITDTLSQVDDEFPPHLRTELLTLLRFAANTLSATDPDNALAAFLNRCEFPGVRIEDQSSWKSIADFLLVQTGEWRKAFNANMGFLAPSATKSPLEKQERQAMKIRLQDFMLEFSANNELRETLVAVQQLPPPQYNDDQWQILEDLVVILPILAAQLQLVFREQRGVDFIEVATRARQALGSADNPTDIALNWDYRIRHLLVDEFQDTATPQFHLLELLTAGWQPNDGRTLFLVGDPMQSIYRFREAEVGLFLRAQQYGLGDIALTPLQLQVNFRSRAGLIGWVNQCFVDIFPAHNEMSVGAVSYSLSHPADETEADAVFFHPLTQKNTEKEAERVVKIITDTRQNNPNARIVILVRARLHASAIIVALQRASLRYQAQDMEKLSFRAVIQDLFALTRALLHPADRIAWLAVLRAPWCGIALADLLVITQHGESGTLWPVLEQFANNTALSQDAKTRLARCVPVLERALSLRGRQSLRPWIESTWQALGGLACIQINADYQNAQRFFALLDECPTDSLYDFTYLENQLNNLFAAVDPNADDRLQIMTMHKAKGLEFDVVILPALERTPMPDKQQLLLWWERPRAHDEADLILGPIKSTYTDSDPIYSYLRYQEARKTKYEITRVLYVAATRAKEALHLIGSIESTPEKEPVPSEDSFLGLLWPHVQHHFQSIPELETSTVPHLGASSQPIRRLPADFTVTQAPTALNNTLVAGEDIQSAFDDFSDVENSSSLDLIPGASVSNSDLPEWAIDQTPEHTGTVIHKTLEQIAKEGLQRWQTFNLSDFHAVWQTQLQQLGVPQDNLNSAISIVEESIANTLSDERGRWILSQHADHHTEYPLTLVQNNKIVHCIIDRTFIDTEGQRWIIDYKSSVPKSHESPESFLREAQIQHANQLRRYAEAFYHLEQRPIQLALYFPRCGLYCAWQYEALSHT